MPTSPITTWEPSSRLTPLYKASRAPLQNIGLAASASYTGGQILAQTSTPGQFKAYAPGNDVQTLTISGSPTGGTFRLRVNGVWTAAIAYNAINSAIATALNATGQFTGTGAAVTGTGPFTITSTSQAIPDITSDSTALTGGSSPAATVVHTTNSAEAAGVPSMILQYTCSTDASSNVTYPGEWAYTNKGIAAYMAGYFSCADLIGLDANVLDRMQGVLISGTLASGVVKFG